MATQSAALKAHAIHRIIRSAQVVLERGRYSWIWVVPRCPYCDTPHDHYGGPLTHPPPTIAGQLFPARCTHADRRQFVLHDPAVALWYVLIAPAAPLREPLPS
jgi:hypothetical protein